MAKLINFSSDNTKKVFAEKSYDEFSQLMFDAGLGQAKMDKNEADETIREIFFELLEIDPSSSRKEIRKAIRRHKIDIYEVIEETVENLLVSGWGSDPFFNDYVEIKSAATGDTNEFYTIDDIILTVSELSGNHHDIIRQKLNEGQSFRVKTSWYGVNF